MKILYICTHNRCRSILLEAISNQRAKGEIIARSAGSQPEGAVHPLTLKYLAEAGIATDGLKSESWDEYADFAPDVVMTVCDSAAGESCPLWFGHSIKLHWGLQDPSKQGGSEEELAQAFRQTIRTVEQRVDTLREIAAYEPELWRAALEKLTSEL